MTMLKSLGNLHDQFFWRIIQWKFKNFSFSIVFLMSVIISELLPTIERHPSVHIEINFCQSTLLFSKM